VAGKADCPAVIRLFSIELEIIENCCNRLAGYFRAEDPRAAAEAIQAEIAAAVAESGKA